MWTHAINFSNDRLVIKWKLSSYAMEAEKAKFSKYGITINPDKAYSGWDYDIHAIAFDTWHTVFDGAVVYLLEYVRSHLNIYKVSSIIETAIEELAKMHIDVAGFDICQSLLKYLKTKYIELRKVQSKLSELATMFGDSDTTINLMAPISSEASILDIIKGIKGLITSNNEDHVRIIHDARKLCEKYNEMAAAVTMSNQSTDEFLQIGYKHIIPEDEFKIFDVDEGEFWTIDSDDVDGILDMVRLLLTTILELSSSASAKTITEFDRLVFYYSSMPSPLIWIIHDESLDEATKQELIRKLALLRTVSNTEINIEVAAGIPKYSSLYTRTPLLHAIEYASPAIVKLLLELGANQHQVYTREEKKKSGHAKGQTTLHYAAKRGDSEILSLILKSGIGVNLQDVHGRTALHVVTDSVCAERLIKHGEDPASIDKNGNTPLHLICKAKITGRFCNSADSETYEQRAEENQSTIETLIKYTPNINKQNRFGYTPLHYAVMAESLLTDHRFYDHVLEKVVLLCKNGADANISSFTEENIEGRFRYKDARNPGCTPLLCLDLKKPSRRTNEICKQISAVVKALITDYGANVLAHTPDGETILHKAVQKGQVRTVRYLLEEIDDDRQLVNFQLNPNCLTPLHIAMQKIRSSYNYNDSIELIDLLLKAGATVDTLYIHIQKYLNGHPCTPKEEKLTPYQYALSLDVKEDNPVLKHLKHWEEKLRQEQLDELTTRYQELMESFSSLPTDGTQQPCEKLNEFNQYIDKLEEESFALSKVFPKAYTQLADLHLSRVNNMILTMESKDEIPEIMIQLRQVLETANKNADADNSNLIEKIQWSWFELSNACLNLKPNQTPLERRVNVARAVVCLLELNKEFNLEKEDHKNLLLELMDLNLDKAHYSLEELKNNYSKKYQSARVAINKEQFDLFCKCDVYTDRNIANPLGITKNVSVIYQDHTRYVFWQQRLPQAGIYRAQDDNQRTRVYETRPKMIMEI